MHTDLCDLFCRVNVAQLFVSSVSNFRGTIFLISTELLPLLNNSVFVVGLLASKAVCASSCICSVKDSFRGLVVVAEVLVEVPDLALLDCND